MGFEVGVGLVGDGGCVGVGGEDVGIEVDVSVAIGVSTVEISVSLTGIWVWDCGVAVMSGLELFTMMKKAINITIIGNDIHGFLLQSII